jgi:hypothetical protein
MPLKFQAAEKAWDFKAEPQSTIVVATPDEDWQYTLTYKYAVNTRGYGQQTLTGHVHYYERDGKCDAKPGRFWVSKDGDKDGDCKGCDAVTPNAIVGKFTDRNVALEVAGLTNIADAAAEGFFVTKAS